MIKRTWHVPVLVVLSAMLVLSACGSENTVKVFPFSMERDAKSFGALTEGFKEQYPDIQFIDATAGIGPGVEPHLVLDTLLQSGNPPDSWQGYAGQALIGDYAVHGQIQPLNDLYEAEGWLDVLPENFIPFISQNGNIYSVSVNVHRTNILWYNPAILEANGIAAPVTMGDWFLAMDAIQSAGITPLAIGGEEARMLLLESILLGSLGPEEYNGLWKGSVNWNGENVKMALDNYRMALTYINIEADVPSWQEAAELVANGGAAFTVMGDWAHGYFRERGKTLTTDYNWAAFPDTDGVFQFYSDAFVLAGNAMNEKGALTWLGFVGSRKGQEIFNSRASSICVRTDCNESLFDEFARSSMSHWSSDDLVGSLTYGVAASQPWKSEIDAALTIFLQDGDVDGFQSALFEACRNSGPCQ